MADESRYRPVGLPTDPPVGQPTDMAENAVMQEKRLAVRQMVFKSAKIVFGPSVIDCLVLNVSEAGVRVRIAAIMAVPERVTLEFSGGAVFAAVRRWAQGLEIGFSLEGTASLPAALAHLAGRIHQMLRAASIEEPMRLLCGVQFFDDPALQAIALEAETALRRLEQSIAERARLTSA